MKNIGRLVSILHRQSQIYMNFALRDFDISSAEYAFLMCLYRTDGLTQEELSSYLYIDKSATHRAIKSLEEKGYVRRVKDRADKRYNRVYLSDKAKTYKDEIRQRVWRWSEFLQEDLETETIETVLAVLEKMVARVEKTDLKSIGVSLIDCK